MAMPEITYFDVRGRAEPIRLILEGRGVDYEDIQVESEEWKTLKPKTPFGGLPTYREGDLALVQSHAIYRHLARRHEIYGADEAQRVRCDMAVEALRDAKDHLGYAAWRPDFQEQRASFEKNELPEKLGALERFFGADLNGPGHWAGVPTFADAVGFAYLDDVDALFPGALVANPSLEKFREEFATRRPIADYLRSTRRPEAIQYGPHGKIYPAPR